MSDHRSPPPKRQPRAGTPGLNSSQSDPTDHDKRQAAQLYDELVRLRQEVASLKKETARLQTKAAQAEADEARVMELREANELLVAATVQARTMAQMAEHEKLQLAHSAHFDFLTDLPNRLLLNDRLSKALELARRHNGKLALLFLDLDRFKPINDTLGHAIGDKLLQSVAQRLVTSVRGSDTVSRLGGDEFVILLSEITQTADAGQIAAKIGAAISKPHVIGSHEVKVATSIGISLYPDDGSDVETLIMRADIAMYEAKAKGRNTYRFFELRMEDQANHSARRRDVAREITGATVNDQGGELPATDIDDPQARTQRPQDSPSPTLSMPDKLAPAMPGQREITSLRASTGEARDFSEPTRSGSVSNTIEPPSEAPRDPASNDSNHKGPQDFMAMLAHELRNPLGPIRTAIAILARIAAAEPRIPWVHDVIKRQVEHMSSLIDELLDVSGAAGRTPLQKRTLALGDLVEHTVSGSRQFADAAGSKITADIPTTPIYVEGDPTRLTQVFSILFNNMSKHLQEGSSIVVSLRPSEHDVTVQMHVEGSFFPEAEPQVAPASSEMENDLKTARSGFEIALAVVRHIIDMHSGTVETKKTDAGQISDIVITLPLQHVIPPQAEPMDPDLQSSPDKYRILLVDDNVDANVSLQALLQMMGHDVSTATDGMEALALIQMIRPQIVVCDIGLPGMDGYQLIQRVREQVIGEMPVMIALTGYGQGKDRSRALDAGFDHHLVKPADPDAFLELIANPEKRK